MSGTSANRPTQNGGWPLLITTMFTITPSVNAIESQRCVCSNPRIHGRTSAGSFASRSTSFPPIIFQP